MEYFDLKSELCTYRIWLNSESSGMACSLSPIRINETNLEFDGPWYIESILGKRRLIILMELSSVSPRLRVTGSGSSPVSDVQAETFRHDFEGSFWQTFEEHELDINRVGWKHRGFAAADGVYYQMRENAWRIEELEVEQAELEAVLEAHREMLASGFDAQLDQAQLEEIRREGVQKGRSDVKLGISPGIEEKLKELSRFPFIHAKEIAFWEGVKFGHSMETFERIFKNEPSG